MKSSHCVLCGSLLKKNGFTSAGKQRWRCPRCGASSVKKYNTDKKHFEGFLNWLLSRSRQADMKGAGRTFRRNTDKFWKVWPLPIPDGEIHRVVFVDGIYLSSEVVILIARSERYVLSWYVARSENSRAWAALLRDIAAPDMVVTDGGSGFAKAVKKVWPQTKVQRCLFHAFCQVKRYTTSRPNLEAGQELYLLAKKLLHIKTLKQADTWVDSYLAWCEKWAGFLEEMTISGSGKTYTHERLRKARASLSRLINQGTLFTYLDPTLAERGELPSTTNAIEGGVNAQLRSVLRDHRGLSLLRRIKAVYWWCYMHTESPLGLKETLQMMPTDDDIDYLYKTYAADPKRDDGGPQWGEGVVWEELHHKTPYPFSID